MSFALLFALCGVGILLGVAGNWFNARAADRLARRLAAFEGAARPPAAAADHIEQWRRDLRALRRSDRGDAPKAVALARRLADLGVAV